MLECPKCSPEIPDCLLAIVPLCQRCTELEIDESLMELAQRISAGLSRKQYRGIDFVHGGPVMHWRRGALRWAGY